MFLKNFIAREEIKMAKKTLIFVMCCAALAFIVTACASSGGGGLPVFGAEMGKQSKGPVTVRIPYTSVVSYFGFVRPGAEPDGVEEGRKMWYLYVWVPIVAPELGIRMISPVPKGMAPKEGDFVSPLWEEGKDNTTAFFDTWITLERADGILSPSDFGRAASANWTRYASNDDSSEMPKNPAGRPYNSLMRVESEISNPLKALVRGLYRVGFTTYKRGEVEGTFLAQVAAPIALPGVAISSSIEELQAKVQE